MFNLKVKRWAYLILGGFSCFYRINFVAFYFFSIFVEVKAFVL